MTPASWSFDCSNSVALSPSKSNREACLKLREQRRSDIERIHLLQIHGSCDENWASLPLRWLLAGKHLFWVVRIQDQKYSVWIIYLQHRYRGELRSKYHCTSDRSEGWRSEKAWPHWWPYSAYPQWFYESWCQWQCFLLLRLHGRLELRLIHDGIWENS